MKCLTATSHFIIIFLQLGLLRCLSYWFLDWHLVIAQKGEGRSLARYAVEER